MAQQVCHYSKFGYCRKEYMCRNIHYQDICDNEKCETLKCSMRRPRYYSENVNIRELGRRFTDIDKDLKVVEPNKT